MVSSNIILLAFDGLSKKHVTNNDIFLGEFKNLDYFETHTEINLGDRPQFYTSEIFTDLITGMEYTTHGVQGLKKYTEGRWGWTPHRQEKWLERNMQTLFMDGISLLGKNFFNNTRRRDLYKGFMDVNYVKYEEGDIEVSTLFDDFDNAHQGQVPVYDWRKADVFHHLEGEYNQTRKCIEHIDDEFHRSKRKFKENFEKITWVEDEPQFQMHHFHYIDWLQHLLVDGQLESTEASEAMSGYWFKAQEFLEEVQEMIEEADQDYELVVMSDHGVPHQYLGHKPNAFISSTADIFPKNPSPWEMNYIIEGFLLSKYSEKDREEIFDQMKEDIIQFRVGNSSDVIKRPLYHDYFKDEENVDMDEITPSLT